MVRTPAKRTPNWKKNSQMERLGCRNCSLAPCRHRKYKDLHVESYKSKLPLKQSQDNASGVFTYTPYGGYRRNTAKVLTDCVRQQSGERAACFSEKDGGTKSYNTCMGQAQNTTPDSIHSLRHPATKPQKSLQIPCLIRRNSH